MVSEDKLRQSFGLPLAIVFGAIFTTLLLGAYLTREYRALQLRESAKSGGLYVEGFLAPHAHEFFAEGELSDESRQKLLSLLSRLPVANYFEILKIWDVNGRMVFSTDGTNYDEDEPADDLRRALAGEIIVDVTLDVINHPDALVEPPFLEIHAPIYDLDNHTVIAVGEIYQDATEFLRQRAAVERSIWTILIVASLIAVTGLLILTSIQRRMHLNHLEEVGRIASQNLALKVEADRARGDSSQATELLLNEIGADLHDGPIQLLSLMLLGLGRQGQDTGDEKPPKMTPKDLGNEVMSQLRSISTGLVLPEISELSLDETLRLAATRHQEFTGSHVVIALADLPNPVDRGLKICCFRLVQEGLMNAFRHTGGSGQRLTVEVIGETLTIVISDDGHTDPAISVNAKPYGSGIGLLGVRQRLSVFHGVLQVRKSDSGGTDLVATIPLK